MSNEQSAENISKTVDIDDSKPVEEVPVDENKKKNMEEYHKSMKEGDRLLFLEDIDNALDKFSDAARLADFIFGELQPDIFQAYLKYGNCLLLYATKLYPVVHMNNNDEAESSDDEEEQNDEEKSVNDDGEKSVNDDGEKSVDDDDEKKDDADEQGTSDEGQNQSLTVNDETVEQEKEDDEQSLDEFEHIIKDAWNVFEVAKKTCERVLDTLTTEDEETKKLWELRRSEVFCYLGRVMLLSDQPQKAKNEFNNALNIKQKYLDENDRQLSSIYFELAKCFEDENSYAEARPFYEKSLNTLKKKIESLETSKEDEKEISELKSLCKEIEDKLLDVEESAKQSKEFRQYAESSNKEPLASVDKIDEESEINDVSNLVRKRTAPRHSDPTTEESDPKKSKSE